MAISEGGNPTPGLQTGLSTARENAPVTVIRIFPPKTELNFFVRAIASIAKLLPKLKK
ncbi:MAG: hypothetical protein AAB437_02415 [Patescibacteria group bacterium]